MSQKIFEKAADHQNCDNSRSADVLFICLTNADAMILIPLEILMLRSISSESVKVTRFESHGLQRHNQSSARSVPLGSLVSLRCHICVADLRRF